MLEYSIAFKRQTYQGHPQKQSSKQNCLLGLMNNSH